MHYSLKFDIQNFVLESHIYKYLFLNNQKYLHQSHFLYYLLFVHKNDYFFLFLIKFFYIFFHQI